jgi:uncharacterized membrane protein YecN with MAPEG domain
MQSVINDDEYSEKRHEIFLQIDPPRPKKGAGSHATSLVLLLIMLFCIFGMPFMESSIRRAVPWGYEPTGFATKPHFYGLVVIFNVLMPTLVTQFFIAFFLVGKGRKSFGYKLPVMAASVDIHIEDVIANGAILSGGDVEMARKKLDGASNYCQHQRAHGNTLESLQMFLVLSIVGGIRYPVSTAVHGLVWCVSRVVWANGYTAGVAPINRYSNPLGTLHWLALLGVMATSIGLAIGLLGGPQLVTT